LQPINWSLGDKTYSLDNSGVRINKEAENLFYGWSEFQNYYAERKSEEEQMMFYEEINQKDASKMVQEVRAVENEDILLVKSERYLFFRPKVKLTVKSENFDKVIEFIESKMPFADSEMESF